MLPPPSPRSAELATRITAFMDGAHLSGRAGVSSASSRDGDRWDEPPVMAELKGKAKAAGLWNLFLPKKHDPDALIVSNTRRCARSWAARRSAPSRSTARRPTPATWKR